MENQKVKQQFRENELIEEIGRLNALLCAKDGQIKMLQRHIATREAASGQLAEDNGLLREEAAKLNHNRSVFR